MKKVIFYTVLLVLGTTLLGVVTSCQKYEDGPMISLRTRTERIANNWRVETYNTDGTDLTSLYTNCTENFSKQGAYSYSCGLFDGLGTWKFQNNDQEIQLEGNDDKSSRKLTILKLKEDSFWYTFESNGNKTEVHLHSQ